MKDLDDYLNIVKQGIASHQQRLNAITQIKHSPCFNSILVQKLLPGHCQADKWSV